MQHWMIDERKDFRTCKMLQIVHFIEISNGMISKQEVTQRFAGLKWSKCCDLIPQSERVAAFAIELMMDRFSNSNLHRFKKSLDSVESDRFGGK
jgi:hypothetical protein